MSGGKPKDIKTPKAPDPTAKPIPGREEQQAKKKILQQRGGRASTILAGRLNQLGAARQALG